MSGITGFINFDGSAADHALLERMVRQIAHRGPDGAESHALGSVAFGHQLLRTLPETCGQAGLLSNERETLWLALDGRLDNRDDLRSKLAAKGFPPRSDSDGELILRTYECWGEDCPQLLLGDFAFVIWDRRKRQVFCARDILGVKPFFYHSNPGRFLWASELGALFADERLQPAPNERMIADVLADAITSREETLFQGIFRLPPAHFLVAREGGIRVRRYWNIDPSKQIRYRDDDEYAEHFLEILQSAVRTRLRSSGPVAAELSGGLDSSAVAVVARDLANRGNACASLEAYSLVFPGLPCDESAYIRDVVSMSGLTHNEISLSPGDSCLPGPDPYRLPEYPNMTMHGGLMSLARRKKARVLLSGLGGDEWLSGSPYYCTDLLRRFRIASCLRELRQRRGANTITAAALSLLVRPFVPAGLRRALRTLLGRGGATGTYPFLTSEFARRAGLFEEREGEPHGRDFASLAQRHVCAGLRDPWLVYQFELVDAYQARFGIEERFPLNDRRIIEFSAALPEDQRWRGTQRKFILRNAMKGMLPESVRLRTTKAVFDPMFAGALLARGERMFESMALSSLGWVNESEYRCMYREIQAAHERGGHVYPTHLWRLWNGFAVDVWFRRVFLKEEVEASVSHSLGLECGIAMG